LLGSRDPLDIIVQWIVQHKDKTAEELKRLLIAKKLGDSYTRPIAKKIVIDLTVGYPYLSPC